LPPDAERVRCGASGLGGDGGRAVVRRAHRPRRRRAGGNPRPAPLATRPAMGQRPQVASGTGCRVAVPSGEAPALPRRSVCKRRSPSGLERFSPTRWSPDLSASHFFPQALPASIPLPHATLVPSSSTNAPCVLLLPACSRLPFLPLLAMPWVLQPPIPNLARSRADDSASLLVRMTSALPTASQ
ncbi:unnamed protein product, partial [Urochloa humidicola]